jgi:hypothetical protein
MGRGEGHEQPKDHRASGVTAPNEVSPFYIMQPANRYIAYLIVTTGLTA